MRRKIVKVWYSYIKDIYNSIAEENNVAQKEAKARLKINMLLSDAGWRLLDNEDGPANVDVENKVDIKKPGRRF